ncbi:MAG: ABC transporter permease [Bryobacteraceae bacterium]
MNPQNSAAHRLLATGSWLLATSLRSLLRAPGFTLAAVLTLALGIGANTAIFSVADAILFRPLPYPNSERLVMVWNRLTKLGLNRLSPVASTAEAYRRLDNIFDSTGGIFWFDRVLTGDTGPERVPGMLITHQVFDMLAPKAALGRIFRPEEYLAGADPVAILSPSLFSRRYGSDPSTLGKSIILDNRSYRIVGVMSPAFEFSLRGGSIDVWTPKPDNPENWGNATRMVARLRPGVSLQAAQSALEAVAKHVDETLHPYNGPHGEDAGYRVQVVSFRDQFLGDFRTVTLILLCAVVAVLLIACVNVANLLLVRAVSREKETTVRRALGATSARLAAQWMAESAVLALLGGALGSIAAAWGVKVLVRLSPSALPGVAKISVDTRALAFTFVISFIVCILFGLAPVLASAKMNWGTRGSTRHSRRAASFLITAEVALAVILMISSGLLFKSFARLRNVDPGFNASHLLTMQTQFPATQPVTKIRSRAFYAELQEKLTALPGVVDATIGNLPIRGALLNPGGGDPFMIKGRAYDSGGSIGQFANMTIVGPNYFRTLQIPLRSGRTFAAGDTADAPLVVMVNEALERAFFPQGAVGQQIGVPQPCYDLTHCEYPWETIIGVAADVKTVGLDRAALPQIYIPHAQQPFPNAGVILRTTGDPLALTRQVSAVVRSMIPDMPVFDVRTMEDRISETIGQPRFETAIVGFFAGAALFLAAIGIFGVVAHSTAQRTQEIGIRMALGADGPRVVKTVVFDGLRPVLLGVLIGLGGALATSRIFSTLLFSIKATDPAIFLTSAAVLTVVAIAACLVPARRAIQVDPMIALRSE